MGKVDLSDEGSLYPDTSLGIKGYTSPQWGGWGKERLEICAKYVYVQIQC